MFSDHLILICRRLIVCQQLIFVSCTSPHVGSASYRILAQHLTSPSRTNLSQSPVINSDLPSCEWPSMPRWTTLPLTKRSPYPPISICSRTSRQNMALNHLPPFPLRTSTSSPMERSVIMSWSSNLV